MPQLLVRHLQKYVKLIGGKTSESIIPANLNCDVCIIDSVAITLLNPTEGKPSIK